MAEMITEQGVTLSTNDEIGEAAVQFYKDQFSEERRVEEYSMLEHIPKCITNAENEVMTKLSNQDEVKKVVFKLNGSSACGPDGFIGHFFQSCWEIIGEDITKVVRAFFCGQKLPKFVTHTNLVLLPKRYQQSFVKGRNITENILLAQEIIRDINRRNKNINVVVKLDMAKAYGRVSGIFLTKVLRKFGFAKAIIDMIWRIMSNNWYSVLINGKAHGFFQSSRGLK
ncbi:uncharacterized protein LOC125844580 [Solanum stenotomum]|uniref:uncharacterized protein LOC125844580 n=1 Tax=Solanum stenotomum TaxID=172797 RepID=UPI0020D11551|nr:uncharacterized protein LOC125844580 [Solanum stenotomum]